MIKENIHISVVIPLYNKAASITSTIQSVLVQNYPYFEIVIIDDGSTDNSAQIVKLIEDKRIRLISKQNGGVSSARNVGIQNAKYDYIAFLDADDLWENEYLYELSKLINDYPEAGLWGTGYSYLENGKYIRARKPLPENFRGYIDNPWQNNIAHSYCSTTSCCRKSSLNEINGFDERISYGEDIDVWWRIALNHKIAYYNKSLAVYRFDFENRLMKRTIPLKKLYICYFEKYNSYRQKNVEFRHFIDQECMWWLFPYKMARTDKNDVQRILNLINFNEYKLSFKFRFKYPYLYSIYLKLINLIKK